jgi:hypothetical protein
MVDRLEESFWASVLSWPMKLSMDSIDFGRVKGGIIGCIDILESRRNSVASVTGLDGQVQLSASRLTLKP